MIITGYYWLFKDLIYCICLVFLLVWFELAKSDLIIGWWISWSLNQTLIVYSFLIIILILLII